MRVVVKSGGWWGVSACEIGREGGVCLAVGSCLVCQHESELMAHTFPNINCVEREGT